MAVNRRQAKMIIKLKLPKADIKAMVEHDGLYLFIAHWDDPDEGGMDPFFSVDKETGAFRDFSPQDYDNPREIIELLQAQIDD